MAFLCVPEVEHAEEVEVPQSCDFVSLISTISLLIGCLQTVESDIPPCLLHWLRTEGEVVYVSDLEKVHALWEERVHEMAG